MGQRFPTDTSRRKSTENCSKIYDAPDPKWKKEDLSAWYIGKTDELLEDVGISRYGISRTKNGDLDRDSKDLHAWECSNKYG
jgi:hypothetical protein